MIGSDAAGAIALAILGAAIGSFVGLVADRLPVGRPVLAGRSGCDACGTTLAPRDLVPIVSRLALSGRCRHCRAPIPFATLHAELAGTTIGALAWLSPAAPAVIAATLGWALLLMALLDLRHYWLPRVGSLTLGAAGLASAALRSSDSLLAAALGALAGWAALALAAVIYARVRRRPGLGGGDAPFLAAAGAWVGWASLPAVLLLGCITAIAHVLVTTRARPARDARAPLGTHLALAWWLVYLVAGPA